MDTTGLAIVIWSETSKRLIILYHLNQVFPENEMNQDARLFKDNQGQIYITYNVFEEANRITLRQRRILFEEPTTLSFSEEEYLLSDFHKSIEKNACYGAPNGDVLYDWGAAMLSIIPKSFAPRYYPAPAFMELAEYYGPDKIVYSMSTPSILWKEGLWIAVGHLKIKYKEINREPLALQLRQVNWSQIHRHGKYIYCAFFWVYDLQFRIHAVSQPFLVDRGSPYLLCVPTGLCRVGERLSLAYGEGDVEAKILHLSQTETEGLLSPRFDQRVYILKTRPFVVIYGYFGHFNTGDEAFQIVWQKWTSRFMQFAEVEFHSETTLRRLERVPHLVILGGGDVINPYFIQPLIDLFPAVPRMAIGVGIPYLDYESLLKVFEFIALRNAKDALRLGVRSVPDLVFMQTASEWRKGLPPHPVPQHRRVVGWSILRPYFNPEFPELYQDYLNAVVAISRRMVDEWDVDILWIPFGLSTHSIKENDVHAVSEIEQLVGNPARARALIPSDSERDCPSDWITQLTRTLPTLDLMICGRFHSHIFSTLCHTPWVSLTCGRKCIEWVKEVNQKEWMYVLSSNAKGIPNRWKETEAPLYDWLSHSWKHRHEMKEKVIRIARRFKESTQSSKEVLEKIILNALEVIDAPPQYVPLEKGMTPSSVVILPSHNHHLLMG